MTDVGFPVFRIFRLDSARFKNAQARQDVDGHASYIRWLNSSQELRTRPLEGDLVLMSNLESQDNKDSAATDLLAALQRGAVAVVYFDQEGGKDGFNITNHSLSGEEHTDLLDRCCSRESPISGNGLWTTAVMHEALEVGLRAVRHYTAAVVVRANALEVGPPDTDEAPVTNVPDSGQRSAPSLPSSSISREHSRQEMLAQALIYCLQIIRFYLVQDTSGNWQKPVVTDDTDWVLDMAEIASTYFHGELAKSTPEECDGLPQRFHSLIQSLHTNENLVRCIRVREFLRAVRKSGLVEDKNWPPDLLATL